MCSKSDCWIELQILPLEGYMKISFLLFTPAENRKCDSGEEAIVQVQAPSPIPTESSGALQGWPIPGFALSNQDCIPPPINNK